MLTSKGVLQQVSRGDFGKMVTHFQASLRSDMEGPICFSQSPSILQAKRH